MMGYGVVYYPGTADLAAAVPVRVGPAEEVTGIELKFLPVPVGTISGTVTAVSTAVPLTSTVITMTPVGAGIS